MAYLVKQLLQPVVIVWIALIAMCGWQIYRHQRRVALISALLAFGLYLAGATPFSIWLLAGLEKPYVNMAESHGQKVDAVVVLGGYLSGGQRREPVGFDVSRHFDRLLTGMEMVRSGRSDRLVVGGGSIRQGNTQISEYELVRVWLEGQKLGTVTMWDLGVCANTREEAEKVFGLMKDHQWESVLLVTSAWHMRRAKAVFQTAGVKVIPVACDFTGFYPSPNSTLLDHYLFFPQAGRLDALRMYLQERVAWLCYRSRGWIKPGA
jgi:uncharacterized SAM-binding protein YcdF (DUF218 family)